MDINQHILHGNLYTKTNQKPSLTCHYEAGKGWYVKNNRINRIITPYINNHLAEAIVLDYEIKKQKKEKQKKDLYYYFGKKTI